MEKVAEKIREYEHLIQVINSEIQETKDLTLQLRLLSEKNDYLAAIMVLKKSLKMNRYAITR